MTDLEERLSEPVQLTTDGNHVYIRVVEEAFREHWVDYAMLQKIYGPESEERRYSPPVRLGTEVDYIAGNPRPRPDLDKLRRAPEPHDADGMRRFIRLTNGFSKKIENLAHAVSLHYMHYNFARSHRSLKDRYPRTPAMAAGKADHIWTLEEIAALLD